MVSRISKLKRDAGLKIIEMDSVEHRLISYDDTRLPDEEGENLTLLELFLYNTAYLSIYCQLKNDDAVSSYRCISAFRKALKEPLQSFEERASEVI